MKFLFVAAGSPATVFGFTPLATAVRNAGHEVVMAASEDLMTPISHLGMPAVSVTPTPLHHFMWTDSSGGPAKWPQGPRETMLFAGRAFARMAESSLDALLDLVRDWRPDMVLGVDHAYAAGLVATHLGVPYARNLLDLAETAEADEGATEILAPQLQKLGIDHLPQPEVLVDVCPPALQDKENASAVQRIRFIAANEQRALEPWMYVRDARKPRVLITAGTRGGPSRAMNAKLLRMLHDALSVLDVDVLVGGLEDVVGDLRAELGDCRVGWLPMDIVAPTCDVIVHHGGGVTALTAASAGTPQLVVPWDDYQIACCRPITDFGAGVLLPPRQDMAEEIARGCREILADPKYKQRSQTLAEEIATQPPPAAVAQVLEQRVAAQRVARGQT
jgi:UDP:flavonoid glycosyltransferase YjiC (YdhE family)